MMPERPPIPPDTLRRIIDGSYGIIPDLRENTLAPNCPEIFVYGTKMADTSVYFPGRGNERNSGAGLTAEQAITAAAGETIERYCSGGWDAADLIFGTYRDLKKDWPMPRPELLDFFHPSQTRALQAYARFTEDTPLSWTRARCLSRNETALVPASAVFLPFRLLFREQGEKTIFPSYSTGLSCGTDAWDALYHALCECVERDAFMNLWFNRLSLPRVDISSAPEIAAVFRRYFDREKLEYRVINTTTDIGITSINCFLTDYSVDPPMTSSGGCAGLSPWNAVSKALLEAAHTWLWAGTLRKNAPEPVAGFENIVSFDDHVGLHASGKIFHSLDFIKNTEKICRVGDLPAFEAASYREAVEIMVRLLAKAGLDVYAADLTTEDIRPLGLSVVRAFVPGLIQLNAGFHMRNLGNRRLYELPRKMGLDHRDRTIEDLNTCPHPYP